MTPKDYPRPRIPEIDSARGVAVSLMVVYHALFDLVFFYGWQVDVHSGIIWIVGRSAAVLFVGIAGISMVLAWKRKHAGQKIEPVKRGIGIIALGMVLTLFTAIWFPNYIIWFGVLHLIGVALIIGTLFLEHPRVAGVIGAVITAIGIYFSISTAQNIIPILPASTSTFDYFPLFPWLGVFLMGMSVGNYFFVPRLQFAHAQTKNPITKALAWAGRRSLIIYFVHQPILFVIFWILMR